jgi:hypothetical protein
MAETQRSGRKPPRAFWRVRRPAISDLGATLKERVLTWKWLVSLPVFAGAIKPGLGARLLGASGTCRLEAEAQLGSILVSRGWWY